MAGASRIQRATSTNGGQWYAYPHIAVNSVATSWWIFAVFVGPAPVLRLFVHLAGDAAGTIRDLWSTKLVRTTTTRTSVRAGTAGATSARCKWIPRTTGLSGPCRIREGTGEYQRRNDRRQWSRWSTYWANVAGPVPTVTIASGPSQSEGNAGLTPFALRRQPVDGYSLPVTVSYQTSDGTATVCRQRLSGASGSIIIPAGATTPFTVTSTLYHFSSTSSSRGSIRWIR